MARKFIIAALGVAGLFLLGLGGQRWFDQQNAVKTVELFLKAQQAGNRQLALGFLHTKQRDAAERNGKLAGTALGKFTFRVHHVELNGKNAVVQLWIESEGYVIKPKFHLERGRSNSWKITDVTDVSVDPLWQDQQVDKVKAADEQLARELAKALEHRPGVKLERVPLPTD